jgi:hypothetical protein
MKCGLFEPTVMFFGLCNSPATFQTMMDELFKELILAGKVIIYIDDILIFHGDSLDEHKVVVAQVLKILMDNHLYLKAEKCTFHAREVGTICGNGQFRMDPLKVQAILDWPVPRNVKDVQTFLGFTNFYQRFIEKYADIARILSKLTGKDQWTWHEEQLEAFDKRSLSFGDGPALHMVQANGRFKIEVDSSGYTNGGVLYQWQNDKWVTIAFRSTVLGPVERNYGIEDRKLLAIIVTLKDWRQYLLSTDKPFEIWTDHANLQHFKDPQKVNRCQAHWLTILSEYNFTLHHFPGKQNVRADALSRRPDYDEGENDNENVTILPEHLFRALVNADQTLMDMIESSQRKNGSRDKVGLNGYILNSKGLVENRGRIFIPYDIELIEEIIWANHDSPISGHPGTNQTQLAVL